VTIRARLALTYGAAVALTILVVGLVVWWQFGTALRSSLQQRLETRSAAVVASLENDGQAGLQESNGNGDLFVILIAADGKRLDASTNAPAQLPLDPSAGPVQEVTGKGRRFLVRIDHTRRGLRRRCRRRSGIHRGVNRPASPDCW